MYKNIYTYSHVYSYLMKDHFTIEDIYIYISGIYHCFLKE